MNFHKMNTYLKKNLGKKPWTKDKIIMSGIVRISCIDTPAAPGVSWPCYKWGIKERVREREFDKMSCQKKRKKKKRIIKQQ